MQLASRFAPRSPILRADHPLSDEQIRAVAPSIFADTPHESRSERYSYIPTASVLAELRGEGFQPFMVCQTRVRHEDRRDYTKHMLRLRHASQINGDEANEIILLNSHDGTSSYQMLAGMFRFVCQNGLVCGDTVADMRVPHKGDVAAQVIEHGVAEDFTSSQLEDFSEMLIRTEVHLQARAWGFTPCTVLPAWVRPTFSESQIEELERIQGYLIEAPEHKVDTVLEVRDAFLQGIGVTDRHMCRAVREGGRYLPKNGRSTVN